ncbi:ATP-binding protein [Aliivibrio fischeri]|uniref:ATP-binding protein n=1 Tax=Aliivibrio fischeri TaxID=668 RepID=UPI0012D9AFB5|nr:ATP-binding protein [Aliivibrio fischeri]MUK28466.1 hypothetical protein [Aliivibrio fischeri]MUK35955.1 hypothetical protein [Aliivibrio fischeri]
MSDQLFQRERLKKRIQMLIFYILTLEVDNKRLRAKDMLLKTEGFPSVETIEQFDFIFISDVPIKSFMDLSSLSFVDKK